MKDFVFHNPTKIVFGEGTIAKLGEETGAFGKKVLLVYGMGSVKRNGIYDKAVASLEDAGLEIVELGGVQPNPVLSHAREGVALAKREQVEVIVAMGGGSVIDESKTIAAGAVTDTDIWEFFKFTAEMKSALPIVTLLTIPAAGSEMNGGMVITNEETNDKWAAGGAGSPVYPKVSILDPTVTYTVPASYVAHSAADAMSHQLEGYLTHQDEWAPIQDRYVEGLLKSIVEATERILADPNDAQGRATMMWAATMAFNDLSSAGVGPIGFPNHLLEHPLSAIYNIPHGAGLAMVMPAWMTYAVRNGNRKITRFAREIFGVETENDETAAMEGIRLFKAWLKKIGTYTAFEDAGIPESGIAKVTERTAVLAQLWGLADYNADNISEIYGMCGPFKAE
jgi:alcohol dehydrogenase YqhD (iron-dependent ADH family)